MTRRPGNRRLHAWLLLVIGALGSTAACGSETTTDAPPPPTPSEPQSSPSTEPTSPDCPKLEILPAGPQMSVWEDGTLAMAIPLELGGDRSATSVEVTAIELEGGRVLEPTALPSSLGVLHPRRWASVEARFEAPTDGAPRRLSLDVQLAVGERRCETEVSTSVRPRAAPADPQESVEVVLPVVDPATTTWPTSPNVDEEREPDAESLPIPPGPPRDLMTTESAPFQLQPIPTLSGDEPHVPEQQGTHRVVFTRNGPVTLPSGTPPDPSVAAVSNSGVVMVSTNTTVSWSNDWGRTFTNVPLWGVIDARNPARTTFFPARDGGLCCDQVLSYSAKHNRFIWVLQTNPTPTPDATGTLVDGPNRLFVAWATPAALVADFASAWRWTEFDSATAQIGRDWMDYPDVTVGDDFVYLSVDVVPFGASWLNGNRLYVRMSIEDMVNARTVTTRVFSASSPGITKGHIARGGTDTMYFAGLQNTSTVRVYSWPDTATTPTTFDVAVTSFANVTGSAAPDGVTWNSAPVGILGAATTMYTPVCFPGAAACDPSPRRRLWLAFPSGATTTPGRARAQPFVRFVTIDMKTQKLHEEHDLHNATIAASLPSIYATCVGGHCDVAFAAAVGGATQWPEQVVGFVGDTTIFPTTGSSATQHWDCTPAGQTTPRVFCSRHGDYFNVMPSQGPLTSTGRGVGFSTLGYSVVATTAGQTCAAGGCRVRPQYVQFGRDGTLVPERVR